MINYDKCYCEVFGDVLKTQWRHYVTLEKRFCNIGQVSVNRWRSGASSPQPLPSARNPPLFLIDTSCRRSGIRRRLRQFEWGALRRRRQSLCSTERSSEIYK
ncbi:uncharacterized protein LOC113389221 [Ctenocephalides felis]|uniref:uncharacterized protein LOC113389221 n=1 Tax=Ctenocephalides felis TaxID=7515 RepID=UPI000E6E182A|nr:uncharacterized protein LOC113389221 [Ctenocephalides felis]